VAASALANATVHGGDTLKIEQKLGRAEMEALAPYLRGNARLRTLVLSGAELGNEKDSVEVLVQALKTNTTVTVLDLWKNNLSAEGAKVVMELLARYVRVVIVFFYFDSPYSNSILISHTTSATTLAIPPWTSPLISSPLTSLPTSPCYHHHRHHLRHHCRYHRATITTDIAFDTTFDITAPPSPPTSPSTSPLTPPLTSSPT
jgi:hypothetical protein